MTVYLCNYLLTVMEGSFLLVPGKGEKMRKAFFCTLASVQLIFLEGLRHVSIGSDTLQYYNHYYVEALSVKITDIGAYFFRYVTGQDKYGPGFLLMEILLQYITHNYQVYLFLFAALCTVPLAVWIYRNSSDPLLSFLLWFGLYYTTFGISAQRQAVAALIVWVGGYGFLKKRKWIPFLAVCIVGAMFHECALFYVVSVFLELLPVTSLSFVAAACFFAMIMICRETIYAVLVPLVGYGDFSVFQSSGALHFTILYLLLFALVAWRYRSILKSRPEARFWINAFLFGMMLLPAVWVNSSAKRVSDFFSIYMIFLIPEVLCSFQFRERMVVRVGMIFVLGILIFLNQWEYLFFWQEI